MKKWLKPCQLCRGKQKARCIICGWSKKKKSGMTEQEKFHEYCLELKQKYFDETRDKLKRFNMTTTHLRSLDLEIIERCGDWLTQEQRYEEELRYLIDLRLQEFWNNGDSDVYDDQLLEMASRWVRNIEIPEAFRVPVDQRARVIRIAVGDFISRQCEVIQE